MAGWYLPYSIESSVKGSQFKQSVTYEKIEANPPIDDLRFRIPAANTKEQPEKQPDASTNPPKKQEARKPGAKPEEDRNK